MAKLYVYTKPGFDGGFDVGGYGIDHYSGYGFGVGFDPNDPLSSPETGSGTVFRHFGGARAGKLSLKKYPVHLIIRSIDDRTQ
jgi:hypothetical protein